METDTNPMEADPNPMEADPNPMEADPNPMEADPNPMEADPNPMEADPNPNPEEAKKSFFKEVDLECTYNNTEHHTIEFSEDKLIVRRGQTFDVTLTLVEATTISEENPLFITALTGEGPKQEDGTLSYLSVPPDVVDVSPSAKATWKLRSKKISDTVYALKLTPPACAPIGEYTLFATHKEEEYILATVVVLFNPWCPADSVFMFKREETQEYVMNEQGVIYKGSGNYIFPMNWDFGQFEDSMVEICMKILNLSHKHTDDPIADVAARCDPIYVSRVVSAMINSEDDRGVLQGNWSGSYVGGRSPSHWTSSHAILSKWLKYDCHPVKFGQCWVFAAVMCSVMRALGIPCRVVTNFQSAHDTDMNLAIDVYHTEHGFPEGDDSVWNFHVWVEAWMRRPDLSNNDEFDGWQVVDPTPQELSDGVFCCGPASVKAILRGETDLMYDVPFVFAEVNADCIDWLVEPDGSLMKIWSDPKRVGQNISTKQIGSKKRQNITDTYKHKEGSDMERAVYKYACSRDYSDDAEWEEEMEVDDEETEEETEDAGTGESEAANEAAGGANAGTPDATSGSANAGAPDATSGSSNAGAPDATSGSANAGAPDATSGSSNAGAPDATSGSANAGTPDATSGSSNAGAPDATSGSSNAGAPDATSGSANAGAPDATSGSSNAGAPDATSGSANAGAPDATSGSSNAGAPDATSGSSNAGAPDATSGSSNAGAPDATSGSSNAGAPDATSGSANAGAPDATSGSSNAGAPDATSGSSNAGAPDATSGSTNAETPKLTLSMRFKEVSPPRNGEDVSLKLVLKSKTDIARQLSINISVQSMMYNSTSAVSILTKAVEKTLQPGKALSIPIKVPFSDYKKPMLDCNSMKISALVKDKNNPENTFLAEDDVVLLDPPISIIMPTELKKDRQATCKITFDNPINEMLTGCTLSLAGSGLVRDESEFQMPDLYPNQRLVVKFIFTPYKIGTKTLMVDFDCSTFRDIKGSCEVQVTA